ncbi:MAG: LEA type 2 family protein [Gammaproteobacteria bacterium]|nr:LEA type 2 family protein [Gammaproteobacteria bacterium]
MNFYNVGAVIKQLLIFGAALLAIGCASVGELAKIADVREPAVSLAETRLNNLTFEGAEFLLLLDIQNPNPLPIKLAGFDYSLNVDGKTITHGKQTSGININAQGSSQVKFPVGIKFADLVSLTKSIGNRDSLPLKIDSNIQVNLPILGMRSIPMSYENQLPIPKPTSVAITSLAVDKLNLNSAAVKVELEVNNPNAFGIDLSRLNYDLAVNGKAWAKSSVNNVAKIPGKGKSRFSIPINLDFATMGTTIYKSLTGSTPLQYQLKGNMILDTALPLLKNVQLPIDQAGSIKAR